MASATLAGVSTVTSTSKVQHNASATLAGVSTVTATSKATYNASALLAGDSTITATGKITRNGAATLADISTITATGKVTHNATATLTSVSTVTATGKITRNACVPPYCLGTGGWCGCNCKCCPPSPCYATYTYVYDCGTLESEWYTGGGPNFGCPCPPFVPFRAPTMPIEFPDFNYRLLQEDESGFVFAQSSSDPACIIPCAAHNIVLNTTGCCLYGSGFSFTAVGSGTVTLSPCPNTPCGTFTCDINGGGASVSVSDCDVVDVTITPPSANCCDCCLTGIFKMNKKAFTSSKFFTQRDTTTGKNRNFLNRQAIVDRIKRTQR